MRIRLQILQENAWANLLMMFDTHAECINEYSNENGFLAVRTMNEAPYCRTISYQAIYNHR